MVKKYKEESRPSFKADMETIKKEDVRKLQETFSQYFGNEPAEMKKHASKIRYKVYFFGLAVTFFFVIVVYLTKNVKFVGI